MSNNLDPDQARHLVQPDLDPNCLQMLPADRNDDDDNGDDDDAWMRQVCYINNDLHVSHKFLIHTIGKIHKVSMYETKNHEKKFLQNFGHLEPGFVQARLGKMQMHFKFVRAFR